jgi:hypothetical protein
LAQGNFDLELLKEILRDKRVHVAVGIIKRLEMAADRSVLRVLVNIYPEERPCICRMTWDAVGPSSGFIQMPVPDDLVLVAFGEGEEEQGYVIRKLSSKVDKIPTEADSGDLIAKSLAGKNTRVISDTKVLLARPESVPTEPLVLGNVLKAALSEWLEAEAVHKHLGNLGYMTSVPDNADVFTSLKSSPVDDEEILSDLSFTEK